MAPLSRSSHRGDTEALGTIRPLFRPDPYPLLAGLATDRYFGEHRLVIEAANANPEIADE